MGTGDGSETFDLRASTSKSPLLRVRWILSIQVACSAAASELALLGAIQLSTGSVPSWVLLVPILSAAGIIIAFVAHGLAYPLEDLPVELTVTAKGLTFRTALGHFREIDWSGIPSDLQVSRPVPLQIWDPVAGDWRAGNREQRDPRWGGSAQFIHPHIHAGSLDADLTSEAYDAILASAQRAGLHLFRPDLVSHDWDYVRIRYPDSR